MTTTAPVKAGISASLSGQFATQGTQALAGLAKWAEYANESGGLRIAGRRHPVTLVHRDDASVADNARRNTEGLIVEDGVDLLFGPYSAGLATAAAEVAESYGRLLWNQGGAGDALYARGYRKVVGILTPADRYLVGAPELARQANPDASKLAILRIDTGAFARIVARGLESAAHALGFATVLDLRYRPTQFRFAEIARAIADLEPDLVAAVGRIPHDIAVAGALAGLPDRSRIGLAVVAATPIAAFADALGAAADGFIGPSQWEPQAATAVANPDCGPSSREALRRLESAGRAYGVPVDYPMAQAFAAGLIAQRCAEAAGTFEDDALRAVAGCLDCSTFYGRFRIDDSGRQIGRSVALVQRQDGGKVVVWPPEAANGELRWPF